MAISYQQMTCPDGATLNYVDVGSGRPLIYLQGFGETIANAYGALEVWSGQFRSLCFDFRGWGDSTPTDNVGVYQTARDLRLFLERFDLQDVTLVGYSMGGSVAFAYLSEFGCDRIGQLVLADTSPKLINEGEYKVGLWQGRYTFKDLEQDLQLIHDHLNLFHMSFYVRSTLPSLPEETLCYPERGDYDAWFAKACEITGLRPALIRRVFNADESPERIRIETRYWREMLEQDKRDVLPNIAVPTLCVYAEPGSFYSPRTAQFCASRIPNAKVEIVPNATHVFPKERFSQYVEIIRNFALRDGLIDN